MFPLRDDNPTELAPFMTLVVLALCVAAWFLLQGAGFSVEALTTSVCTWGAIPAEITGAQGGSGPCRLGGLTWEALVTSMFLHGSWMHLIGNLWFLWIFGNNVEDSMGHGRFVVFYLVTGLAAALAHVLLNTGSAVPMVGASGAISGVMGAYLLLYPRARVHTLFFFIFFVRVVPLPAWVLLGYWMLLQVAGLGAAATVGGGVAYAAHVGGFLAGIALIPFFSRQTLVQAKRSDRVLDRRELDRGGWW